MHEPDAPKISYEAFTQELNEGDSFTARLFDVLVMVCSLRLSAYYDYSELDCTGSCQSPFETSCIGTPSYY